MTFWQRHETSVLDKKYKIWNTRSLRVGGVIDQTVFAKNFEIRPLIHILISSENLQLLHQEFKIRIFENGESGFLNNAYSYFENNSLNETWKYDYDKQSRKWPEPQNDQSLVLVRFLPSYTVKERESKLQISNKNFKVRICWRVKSYRVHRKSQI